MVTSGKKYILMHSSQKNKEQDEPLDFSKFTTVNFTILDAHFHDNKVIHNNVRINLKQIRLCCLQGSGPF
jgi:hypothetical protein